MVDIFAKKGFRRVFAFVFFSQINVKLRKLLLLSWNFSKLQYFRAASYTSVSCGNDVQCFSFEFQLLSASLSEDRVLRLKIEFLRNNCRRSRVAKRLRKFGDKLSTKLFLNVENTCLLIFWRDRIFRKTSIFVENCRKLNLFFRTHLFSQVLLVSMTIGS